MIVRECVEFLHADHLGSTSLTTNMSQAIVGQQRYYAYGEPRNGAGALHTDRRFTGQREESGLGSLYDYNARYYSPLIGRFISADSIVPEPGNPQAFNRYMYVFNNPLKYVDPSGHDPCGGPGVHVPDCGVDDPVSLNNYRYACVKGWGCFDMAHARGFPFPKGQRDFWQNFVAQASTGKGFSINLEHRGPGIHLSITYSVAALRPEQYQGVAMGIYQDFAYEMESLPYPTSSFDNYDLPSDYLGMVAAMRNATANELLFELGGQVSYYEDQPDSKCLFPCAAQNYEFTPKPKSNGYVNKPWPESLQVDANTDTTLWQREFYYAFDVFRFGAQLVTNAYWIDLNAP